VDQPGALMADEIAQQPAVLAHLLNAGSDEIAAVRARIRSQGPRFVIFAARGTSDHAALYAKYLVEVCSQLPAGLASPSTLTVYGARPDLREVLFVAVSQSGSSPDLVGSVEVARECGALTVAVTNSADSALARAATEHVDILAGPERAVAATKTYTAQLLALYLLLVGGDASALPDAAAGTLALAEQSAVSAAGRYRYAERLVTTGRGYSYATARESALKVMETSYLPAQAFSGADLLHGPMAMVDTGTPVIAIMSTGAGGTAMAPVVARLETAGADVLRVGPPDGLPISSAGVPEELAPVLEILPLQRLAWQMARDRGLDPDRPRGLSKVTQTW
jgi:glucosamine--fructose-6-phosphate aminotransferase (isomerizing)